MNVLKLVRDKTGLPQLTGWGLILMAMQTRSSQNQTTAWLNGLSAGSRVLVSSLVLDFSARLRCCGSLPELASSAFVCLLRCSSWLCRSGFLVSSCLELMTCRNVTGIGASHSTIDRKSTRLNSSHR